MCVEGCLVRELVLGGAVFEVWDVCFVFQMKLWRGWVSGRL